MTPTNYRADIDGLRCLAVVPVVLFHAGWGGMPGGFIGVDIFFVISGYLISSIILREVQTGEFSFLRFYERRLRRIVPALVVMLLVTVTVFQIISLPDQAEGASKSAIAALLSVSNFYFWSQSGYFAPVTEFMPLLHTWSLAVEEQFYLLFPVILLAMWRFKLPIKSVLAIGVCLAFVIGLWLSEHKPSVAYYLLPARAWELGLGAVIASGLLPKVTNRSLCEALVAMGGAFIVFGLFWIRSDMTFPGWVALLPCIGAAMIIHSGANSWLARNVLAARPIVFVGLVSYSLYLWHWPVLAGLRILNANVSLGPIMSAWAVAAAFLLAYLSWRFVEQPFRNRREKSIKQVLAILGGFSIMLLGIGSVSVAMEGFPDRLEKSARLALAATKDIDPLKRACNEEKHQAVCRFGVADSPVTVVVVGDSHAAAIVPAIEQSSLIANAGGALWWLANCPLLDGATLRTASGRIENSLCAPFKKAVWDALEKSPEPKTVVLAGRWPVQMTGWLPEKARSDHMYLTDDETRAPSESDSKRVFLRSLGRTLDRLEALGLDVVIIGSVPEPGYDVPHTIALARHNGLRETAGVSRRSVDSRAGKQIGRSLVWCRGASMFDSCPYGNRFVTIFGVQSS